MLSLSPGGTERLVIDICRRLQPDLDVSVCCLDEPGSWSAQVETAGVPVTALQRRPGFRPSLAYRIARLAARTGIDVLHCHQYSPYVYGALATLARPGMRLVFTEHGRLSDAPPSWKRRLVNPYLTRLPGRLCAVSADMKRHMVDAGFAAQRIEVVHNGIAPGPPTLRADREAARAELRLPADAFVVGTVGRLDPVKNLGLLIRACASATRDRPSTYLVVVGDGPERDRLRSLASRMGVAERVLFTGYRDDVRRLMSAFDVYVNSSVYEGVSLTILEAMAAGLPVIATRVGGNPEVVVHDGTGLLVGPSAVGELADAIRRLNDDQASARSFGAAGRSRVSGHFSFDRMVERYRDMYFELIAPTHAAAPYVSVAEADGTRDSMKN